MTVSSACTAVPANIAPTAKQIILLNLILIPFPVNSGSTQHLFGAPTDGEGAHRSRIGMRLSFHKIIFNVPAEFLAKHVTPIFPEGFTTRRAHQVHDDNLPPPSTVAARAIFLA